LAASIRAPRGAGKRGRDRADLPALPDRAELDFAEPLTGEVLVAVADGHLLAALGVDDGRVISDPFRRTSAAVELLRLRVARRAAAGEGAARAVAIPSQGRRRGGSMAMTPAVSHPYILAITA
jgi:predicted methyltransferase MtxX (methanogen marker protein 4)